MTNWGFKSVVRYSVTKKIPHVVVHAGYLCLTILFSLFEEFEVFAEVLCLVAEALFDAHKLVVFADAVGTAGTAGLDEAGVESDDEVGNGGVLSLAGTVGDDGGVAIAGGKVDSVDGLGEGANLVELNKDGVGHFAVKTHLQTLDVGDEEVVANKLAAVADGVGEEFPAVPIVFGHAVLDGDDGVLLNPAFPEVDHLGSIVLLARGPTHLVETRLGVVVLGGCSIETDEDVLARTVAGLLDGLADHLDGLVVGAQVGGKAAFVAHVGGHVAGLKDGAEVVEHFGTHTESFGEGGGTDGHNHEFLKVDAVVGMGTAVEDVHHGDGEHVAAATAKIAVKLLARLHGSGLGTGEGDTEDGIGTKTTLVGGAVKFNHLLVDGTLLFDIHAAKFFVEDVVDIVDCLKDAFAKVDGLVAVAEFAGLVDAGGGSGGDCGATHGALFGEYFDLDCGVAARVENLAAPDCYNL